jgi:chemosensory pili system protein ChpB (putative protein-glutamate methylesterase)
MNTGLAVGVIAASVKQMSELGRLVKGAGYAVAASVEIKPGLAGPLPQVDVWVANLDLHDPGVRAVMDGLDLNGPPVIYEDDLQLVPEVATPADEKPMLPAEIRQHKERRLALKLRQLVRDSERESRRRAQKVWVLAASTGGPDAVAQFLAGIPDDLDGVALLYVQHIEQQALESLQRVVTRHCGWRVENTDEARVIREKTVYLVSPQHAFDILDGGVLSPLAQPWGGRYRPSIDQVIAKVARVYRDRGGAIVFTGMGDDGADSCTMLHYRGGQVWIQAAASCTIDSMPVSVAKKGFVQFSAAPEELARQFVKLHKQGVRPTQPLTPSERAP